MRGKLLFITGAAVGYVLGARAGRKRYEQIKSTASKVWESPGIQRQVNSAQDYAAEKIGEIPGALFSGAKKVLSNRGSAKPPARSASGETSTVAETVSEAKSAASKASSAATASTKKPASSSRSRPAAPAAGETDD